MPFAKGHKHSPKGPPKGPRKKKLWEPSWEDMDACEKSMEDLQQNVDKHYPSRSNLFKKVLSGKASMRAVIKAKCLDCCTFSLEEVYQCRVFRCPIWKYRPMASKTKTETSNE